MATSAAVDWASVDGNQFGSVVKAHTYSALCTQGAIRIAPRRAVALAPPTIAPVQPRAARGTRVTRQLIDVMVPRPGGMTACRQRAERRNSLRSMGRRTLDVHAMRLERGRSRHQGQSLQAPRSKSSLIQPCSAPATAFESFRSTDL